MRYKIPICVEYFHTLGGKRQIRTVEITILQTVLLNHLSILPKLVELKGIEPLTSCLQGRRSPSWAIAPYKTLLPRLWLYMAFGQGNLNLGFHCYVAPLRTNGMFLDYIQRFLLPSKHGRYLFHFGAPPETRTPDTHIKSVVLYHLS